MAYDGVHGYASDLRPIKRVARWAMILAAITGVATLASALLSANLSAQANDFLDGRISEDAFLDANAFAPVGQVLGAVPMFAAGVLAMIWMYRIATNVRALGRRTTFAPVFAIVGWFLPPFLFVVPLLVLRELWKASDPDTPPGTDGWRQSGESPLLYGWFVLYGVIPTILTLITISQVLDATLSLDTDAEAIAEVASSSSPLTLLLTGLISLASAVAWVLLIKRWTDRHVTATGED